MNRDRSRSRIAFESRVVRMRQIVIAAGHFAFRISSQECA